MDEEAKGKSLTIKIANSGGKKIVGPASLSPCHSPLISPPSSAFVSAPQSPYISPRVAGENPSLGEGSCPTPETSVTQSDDLPSSSYTPPSMTRDIPADQNPNVVACAPAVRDPGPRISFSFQIPRISFAKSSLSLPSNVKLRSCDVYIGYHGQDPNLVRFCKWLKSELEIQGISCFVADRARYSDKQSHEIADRVISSVAHGVSVVTNASLCNHLSLDEIRFFAQRKNLIPLFFDKIPGIFSPQSCNNKELKDAIERLTRFHHHKLEAKDGNWRLCVYRAAGILTAKLGRKNVSVKESQQLPFPRNKCFIGRERELMDMETAFFGESETRRCSDQEPNPEPCVRRPKYGSIVCVNGPPGIGKTELALEFAYRFCQRYKAVLWVGGESRYFGQNILNTSLNMGLDMNADEEESKAFKRVKRELFRDTPYLMVIDNLENEREWWEGRGLNELIPRNTGGSHIIITTRLPKVMGLDPLHLPMLPLPQAMTLIRGRRRRREYVADELHFFTKFSEKLGRSSLGLSVVGSLLSELAIGPSALFEAVTRAQLQESLSCCLTAVERQLCQNSSYLMKLLSFCADVLEGMGASRMLQAGAWLAPAPVSAHMLAPSRNTRWCFSAANRMWKGESALILVRLGLARRVQWEQPGLWIQLHPITQAFTKWRYGPGGSMATVQGVWNTHYHSDHHLWASAFLVLGLKSEPPVVQLEAADMVLFIKKVALPLAVRAFTRCSSALELLRACTRVLEEFEDWEEVTLLKAGMLETRAKLMMVRGGDFEGAEELCRSCVSIRTLVLGHTHAQTLAAQETLAWLLRIRTNC